MEEVCCPAKRVAINMPAISWSFKGRPPSTFTYLLSTNTCKKASLTRSSDSHIYPVAAANNHLTFLNIVPFATASMHYRPPLANGDKNRGSPWLAFDSACAGSLEWKNRQMRSSNPPDATIQEKAHGCAAGGAGGGVNLHHVALFRRGCPRSSSRLDDLAENCSQFLSSPARRSQYLNL